MNSIAIVVAWDQDSRSLHRYLHACAWQLSPADGLYVVSDAALPADGVPFQAYTSLRDCAQAITQDLVLVLGPHVVLAPFVVAHLARATESFDALLAARRWVSPPHAGCTLPETDLAHRFGEHSLPSSQFVLRAAVFRELVRELPFADWSREWFRWLHRRERAILLADFPLGYENLARVLPRRESIGVVIPVYREPAAYVLRAVASCYQQLQDGEPLVVVRDHGATVDLGFLERYRFSDLQIIDNTWGKGLSGCRNTGLDRVQTRWIKFLDGDDVLAPYALAALCHPPPAQTQVLCGGMVWVIDGAYQGILAATPVHAEHFVYGNSLVTSRTLIRRQAILEAHYYDVRLGFEEDYDMWLRLAKRHGLAAFLPHPQIFTYYWLESARRQAAVKERNYLVEGRPIRDYFCQTYGVRSVFQPELPNAGGLRDVTQHIPEPLA